MLGEKDRIGDYIHLHAYNYRKYGTITQIASRIGDDDGEDCYDLEKVYNEVSSQLKMRIGALDSFPNKKDFEYKLNFFAGRGKNNYNVPTKKEENMKKAIIRLLEKDFDKSLGEVDFNTYDISTDALHRKKGKSEKLYKEAIESHRTWLSTVYRRMNTIETICRTLKDVKKQKELEEKINHAYQIIRELDLKNAKKEIKSGALKNDVLRERNWYTTKNGENLVDYVNGLLDEISEINIALQKGNFFEYVVAAIGAESKILADESVSSIMKKIQKESHGSDRTKVQINCKDNLSNKLDYNKISATMGSQSESGRIYQSTIASQGKLDVTVEWGGKVRKISAKNYNLFSSYDMKIVEGQSLLYLLQDENHRFVNHYLNIVSEHTNDKENEKNYFVMERTQAYQNAVDLMEKIILFKALTGKTYQRDAMSAEIFIVNNNKNNTNNGIKIYDMKDLLSIANANMSAYTRIVSNEKTNFNALSFKNKKAISGYPERITDLLMEVHAAKITAYLKKGILNAPVPIIS